MTEASFDVDVTAESALAFAGVSGDWNPLHTDAAHAARTAYRRPVLHGAFSAGLVSRMAGMHLPGRDCLLHALDLKFVAPIVPPATLRVSGHITSERHGIGHVKVAITDAATGTHYVTASYQFGRHQADDATTSAPTPARVETTDESTILVTGASGGLGRALIARLGSRATGVTRTPIEGMLTAASIDELRAALGTRRLDAIVHCAWPSPDNQRLVALGDPSGAVAHHVSEPLSQMIGLAQLLAERGTTNAPLLLIGSTAAMPGRHNYRMPLYTLSKSLVPELVRILAVELAATSHRAMGVVFDVIETGMNQRLSASARIAHANRAPSGQLPSADDAAAQLEWMLAGPGWLASGATVTLSGGALP